MSKGTAANATPPHDPANPNLPNSIPLELAPMARATTPEETRKHAVGAQKELEQELFKGYQSLAEILSDNAVTGYHRKYGLHNTSLLEDLEEFVFRQNQVAHEEGRKEELQKIITDAICMRPDCETLHYKHAYEKAVMRLAELEKGKPE